MPDIKAEITCGACPLQIEGTINGVPFYFRSRWDRWRIGIGGEPVGEPEWERSENWGDNPGAAGWMPEETGMEIVEEMATLWETEKKNEAT